VRVAPKLAPAKGLIDAMLLEQGDLTAVERQNVATTKAVAAARVAVIAARVRGRSTVSSPISVRSRSHATASISRAQAAGFGCAKVPTASRRRWRIKSGRRLISRMYGACEFSCAARDIPWSRLMTLG